MESHVSSKPERLVSQLLRDEPDLRDVVSDFVQGIDEQLARMQEAYAQLDWEMLSTLAHRLKGAGGSYGYPEISSLCAELEQQFRDHRAEEFHRRLAELNHLVEAARAGLAPSQ